MADDSILAELQRLHDAGEHWWIPYLKRTLSKMRRWSATVTYGGEHNLVGYLSPHEDCIEFYYIWHNTLVYSSYQYEQITSFSTSPDGVHLFVNKKPIHINEAQT